MNDEQTKKHDKDVCDCLELRKQCEEYRAGWQRAVADYQNLLKENARARAEWAGWSEAQILEEFLPVYDNFKKAFAGAKDGDSWAKGIQFIMKQFGDILKAHGVEEIKTVGEQFDATKHETVGEETSEQPEHTILKEIDGGYMVKGRVLKVAKVIVSKK